MTYLFVANLFNDQNWIVNTRKSINQKYNAIITFKLRQKAR